MAKHDEFKNLKTSPKRELKIAARRLMADDLQRQINGMGSALLLFMRMSFGARVRWMFTGAMPFRAPEQE